MSTQSTQRTPGSIVIVGGGLAGAKTAGALREKGFHGALTLFAAEPHLPYERPPLSKGCLLGSSTFDEAVVYPRQWYTENEVDLRLGVRVQSIDVGAHEVRADDGSTTAYDRLVLATGAVPRTLPIAGADASGVLYLRTREDAEQIRRACEAGRHMVIIGGGWIGLEIAAAARSAGTDVTVVEAAELPLLAALGPTLARVFADLHTARGVTLRLSARLAEITTDGERATGVRLEGGETIPADTVVIGIGVTPDVSLAAGAGLDVDDGVLVDAHLRTSDPDIYAIGDIAKVDHPVLGERIRVEHWATALNQPTTAAAAILGEDAQWSDLPYFYTDQYDLGMEYIGHVPRGTPDDVVIRGDLAGREFIAFWLGEDGRVLAGMNVNIWDVVDDVKALILSGQPVDRERLADPSTDLGCLLRTDAS